MNILNAKNALRSYALSSANSVNKETSTTNSYKNPKRDIVEISNTAVAMSGSLDKGTAAHTTLYVDYSTFQQIANYTTNNPECHWSEMGVDGEKRWIVVNGQRFESPLSEEEKERMKRSSTSKTLLDYLIEYEDKKAVWKKRANDLDKIEIDFNGSSPSINKQIVNSKLTNLFENEKVMKMLNDISKIRGGKISLSTSL
ncbi:hypothetical protein [Virgibacillus proomii]|uniref:hypothetical protein n=1 Tax=Virgibacillus proomii TaxID=84407 RepID=UPI001C0F71A8|nr:hypothetical protein [Virgibacillus proomii]MBU5266527.1 hypothetical protein [Virgibacillus proomii]